MRDDMAKVIVERPRHRGLTTHASRRFRNQEELGAKIGIQRGYRDRKALNENLAPLRRWLASQVNRPWNKVYSELCANIDRRNTVQAHIFTHIDQFVEIETRLIDGQIHVVDKWWRRIIPLERAGGELYVHPVTGILRKNVERLIFKQRRMAEQRMQADHRDAQRRDLDGMTQLRKLNGIWYRVTLAEIPLPRVSIDRTSGRQKVDYPQVWDVVRRQLVSRSSTRPRGTNRHHPPLEKAWVYAKTKRQLSSAELRQHKLTNDNAGISRRCCLGRRRSRAPLVVSTPQQLPALIELPACRASSGATGRHRRTCPPGQRCNSDAFGGDAIDMSVRA